ncbi:DUF6351 family protein [Pseudoduganella sp. LjRoot289]|uniref:DUF6351 family protein n=1 Tax=Pseudoduganella sp. LjRoot289 TaxID=3342314 RepID=UPI003ED0DB70
MPTRSFWAACAVAACGASAAIPAAAAPQQPFVCRSEESGLGPPLVDNQQGIGHPVFDAEGQLLGHSQFCKIQTRVLHLYYNGSRFKPYDPADPPSDMKSATYNGAKVPFVVRVEAGTINRFLYTIVTLAPEAAAPSWNGKLIYWLRGGVGIGHQQGIAMWVNERLNGSERALMPKLLEQGYAVVSSSGNETGVHYNMQLAAETAAQTKARFVEAYGKPKFTIGIGGSGGAVQQYMFAQNRPGLLDAGIAIQSYPDMVTQTIPISDCPLLGQYFKDEAELNPSSPWAKPRNHALIEGMNASDSSTECISGWKMAMPSVLNPVFKDPKFDAGARHYRYPANVFANVKWTHWNDLAEIYGTDSKGYAPIPLDNVGVQYGLDALARGQIGADEFLRINACIGGWKEQADFVQWEMKDDPFDSRNMKRSATCRSPDGMPAPRRAGDVSAMQKAYTSGHVFSGQRLGMPVIDLRPYLEAELNMHNARQSFSVRQRLLDANPGEAKNQVIWFTRLDADLGARVLEALPVLERHLASGSAPADFTDKCFDTGSALIAAGPSVWDGILNRNAPGACTRAYPVYSSPRMVAGGSIKGDVFKCALKPVASALADGTYPAAVQFTAAQTDWLKRIFPQGVCDYAQGDQGRP